MSFKMKIAASIFILAVMKGVSAGYQNDATLFDAIQSDLDDYNSDKRLQNRLMIYRWGRLTAKDARKLTG
jgi:hypothetical protein